MTDAEPRSPLGVVVVYRDGVRVPAEVYYTGLVEGTHYWTLTTPVDFEHLDHVHVDMIPAHTAIVFPAPQE